jgi:arylsulfatase A-like enzyme
LLVRFRPSRHNEIILKLPAEPFLNGFDEFSGNLYHLNAEEEPERPCWNSVTKSDPAFQRTYAPRSVIHSDADGKIEDTGPLTATRMETSDEEFEMQQRHTSKSRHQHEHLFRLDVLHAHHRCGTRAKRHAW